MNKHLEHSTILRAQGNYIEAVAEIENNLSSFDELERQPALIQAFYAAKEGSLNKKARELARIIAQEDPDLPSIQNYL